MSDHKTAQAVETWIEAFEHTEMGGLSQAGIDELLLILYSFRRMRDDLSWVIELSDGIEDIETTMGKIIETAKDSLLFDPLSSK